MPFTSEAFWVATSALAAVALLCVTAVYAWVAYIQLWEAHRPRLLVALRTNQGGQFMLLHIENVGTTPATNLRFTFDRPVHRTFGDKCDLRDIPLFAKGLRALPPNTPSRFGLGVAFSYLDENVDRTKHPTSFTISASYDYKGRTIREAFPFDVEDQYASSSVERDNLDEFARKFPDEFRRALQELATAIESRNA